MASHLRSHRNRMAEATASRMIDCLKKRKFESLEEVEKFIAENGLEPGAYFCMFCEHFHLTSSPGTKHY